jgi:hypothetical protein
MKNHTKKYLDFFGYDKTDFIPSELSGAKAVDIHHIDCKGMGGDPTGDKDNIFNLMALSREEHELYGDKKEFMKFLRSQHLDFMMLHKPLQTKQLVEDYYK